MDNLVHDAERLKELQSLPLERKIQITQTRIIEWYQHYNGNVYISFSGGKDSTVLLHIARQIFPNIPACFSNTGLEYPEIQKFVRTFDNVDIITPETNFGKVISEFGYPLISKEVAEAIYYSRRIKPKDSTAHHTKHNASNYWNYCPQSEHKRNELCGKCIDEKSNLINTSHARNRRTVLSGNWKTTDEDGIIKKSQFNKEKWLPLARDLPVLISHRCCMKMKKSPMHKYQTLMGYKPILATLAEEGRARKQAWIRHGCNAFVGKNPTSQPMSFWTEQDVLAYIVKYNISIASVYGDIVSVSESGESYPPSDLMGNPLCNLQCTGCQRTGCVYCAFGAHLEKGETRFQRLAKTHPRQYEYCMGGGEWIDNPHYDPSAPKMDGEWQNWNPKKIWTRNGKGLGMGKVFDMCNEIYGKDFYRYE